MLDSPLIEVGIGLSLIFFVLASFVAAFNEWLTRVLDIRAKVLWKSLASLVDSDGGDPLTIRTRDAYSMLAFADRRPRRTRATADEPSPRMTERIAGTSVVQPQGGARAEVLGERVRCDQLGTSIFRAALLEVGNADEAQLRAEIGKHERQYQQAVQRAARTDVEATDVVAGWELVEDPDRLATLIWKGFGDARQAEPIAAAANAWRLAAQARGDEPERYARLVEEAKSKTARLTRSAMPSASLPKTEELDVVHRIAEGAKGSALEGVINGALARNPASTKEVMDAVDDWFDDSMARLSELYRVASRQVLFGLGLLIAVVANVGAIDLVGDLQQSADTRDALVAGAASPACSADATPCFKAASDLVTAPVIGDYQPPWQAMGWGLDEAQPPVDNVGRIQALAGWLITAFALSFGAPFWFDVFRRLGSWRGSSRRSA